MQLFSPWEYNVDKASARLLQATGWNSPDPQSYPTGGELYEKYLEPLATKTPLRDRIRTESRVVGISRVGLDKLKTAGRADARFEVRYDNGVGGKSLQADAIIDATGTWFKPSSAGANGLSARGETAGAVASRLAYGMPDVLGGARARYAGKRVAVLGAGHSAVGTLSSRPLQTLARNACPADPRRQLAVVRRWRAMRSRAVPWEACSQLAGETARLKPVSGVRSAVTQDGLRIGAGSACCGRSVIVDQLIVAAGSAD